MIKQNNNQAGGTDDTLVTPVVYLIHNFSITIIIHTTASLKCIYKSVLKIKDIEMDEISMDVNESRKILFEEATADDDFRSSFQSC